MNSILNKIDFYRCSMILCVITIYLKYINTTDKFILYVSILMIAWINDKIRFKYYDNRRRYYISYFISFGIAVLLTIFCGNSIIYYYVVMAEAILVFPNKKINIMVLMSIVINVIMTQLMGLVYSVEYGEKFIFSFRETILSLSIYIFYMVSMYSIRVDRQKTIQINKLNKELKQSMNEIKELTIVKERNRVAQEIHDSLGHSLTALIMHLDFLEKIAINNPTKALEITQKCEKISKESMKELRKAIYELKEFEVSSDFLDSLRVIVNDIIKFNDIDITLDVYGEINNISESIKKTIYSIVKESITNSINHGKASKINIKLNKTEEDIFLSIKDNGIGCSEIIKGNGLIGIENRIKKVEGKLNITSNKDEGFYIQTEIQLKSEN